MQQEDGQQQARLDPQRVIDRLRQQLSEAQIQAAQYAALADQLAEENAHLKAGNAERAVDEAFTVNGTTED